MSSLLDRTLQLSMLELLAELYPAEVETLLLQPDRSTDRALRFNLMALKAHDLVELRAIDDGDLPRPIQLVRITPRGLAELEGEWEPETDPMPLDRLFEDSRPADLRGLQPLPLPSYLAPSHHGGPVAALRGLFLEAAGGLVAAAELVARVCSRGRPVRRHPRRALAASSRLPY